MTRTSIQLLFLLPACFAAVAFSGGAIASPAENSADAQLLGSGSKIAVSIARPKRHPQLIVPPALRERVDFWKNIFAEYGRNQIVIHHRDFPQASFMVIDLQRESEQMDPISFDRFRKNEIEKHISQVKAALERLGRGLPPQSPLEELIVSEMSFIPGGNEKYARAVKEDLVRSQSGIRDKFMEAVRRSGRYLPMIERIFVQDFRLPIELTRMPFVESSFDYTAYSSAGAAGIWQFMPKTATQYMMVSSLIDERRDPLKATEGAARYLQHAYRTLESWPLAITSYNHGIGGVLKRVKEYGTSDITALIEHRTARPFGFASSNFYPSFLAALEAYEEHGILFPELEIEPALRFSQVRLPRTSSISHIERQLEVPRDELRRYNYALSEKIWSGKASVPAGYYLRVPEHASAMVARLNAPEAAAQSIAGSAAPAASSIYGGLVYRVRRGDTLTSIAKRYEVSVQQIKDLNGIDTRPLKVGETLVLKQSEAEETKSARHAPAANQPDLTDLNGSAYQVRPGDTLHSMSRKFGVSVEEIMLQNDLSSSNVRVGQKLMIPSGKQNKAKAAADAAPGSSYLVAQGDTLWSISKKLGVSVETLKSANKLRGIKLKVGQRLVIPE